MRRLIVMSIAMLGALALAGCGVPGSSKLERIDANDVPFGLDQTTTTSTTTTTTIAPSTTAALEPTTTLVVTTLAVETEPVDLYFATGSRLTVISKPLAKDAKAQQILAALVDGPPAGDLGFGLRAVIPPRAKLSVDVVAGVATVELPGDLFDRMSPSDERLVYGQIVLTLTSARGIGQVTFTQDSEPLRVLLEDGSRSEPGQLLVYEDYDQLKIGGAEPPPVTTTTTTTTTPTTPETDVEAATGTTGATPDVTTIPP